MVNLVITLFDDMRYYNTAINNFVKDYTTILKQITNSKKKEKRRIDLIKSLPIVWTQNQCTCFQETFDKFNFCWSCNGR